MRRTRKQYMALVKNSSVVGDDDEEEADEAAFASPESCSGNTVNATSIMHRVLRANSLDIIACVRLLSMVVSTMSMTGLLEGLRSETTLSLVLLDALDHFLCIAQSLLSGTNISPSADAAFDRRAVRFLRAELRVRRERISDFRRARATVAASRSFSSSSSSDVEESRSPVDSFEEANNMLQNRNGNATVQCMKDQTSETQALASEDA